VTHHLFGQGEPPKVSLRLIKPIFCTKLHI
jgi:hypothetical protein